MHKKLSWFDRLIIKIALAKSVARGECSSGATDFLIKSFQKITTSGCTCQSSDHEAQQ